MRLLPMALATLTAPAWAQDPLTLRDATEQALKHHPSLQAEAARVAASETRLEQARSGYLPKVNYSESAQRSNNPVFVFGSLLTQHQFTEQNFAVGPLNRPDFLNNFQSQVTVDQLVYDGRQVRAQMKSAELGRGMAQEERRGVEMQVIMGVARSYLGAVLADESLRVAKEAMRSARADLDRAEAVRTAGLSTDADVLSIRVHLASVREQEIRRTHELAVARAALNEGVGLPLDTDHQLTTPLAELKAMAPELSEYEERATAQRPETRLTSLATRMAETQAAVARSGLLPQVGVRAAFEVDRQTFANRGGANWFFAGTLRWNLFNGFADRARIEEANHQIQGARALERRSAAAVRLEVRRADADLKAALERITVAQASVAMAEESLRITKNRYENGLSTVTDLLRTETALLEVRTRRLAAIHDSRVAAAALEVAAGTLNVQSEVLR